MPRPPHAAAGVVAMPGAVFSPIEHRLRELSGTVYPLHVGDTWLDPCEGARSQDLVADEQPGLHHYCETRGLPPLVDALVEKVRAQNGLACEPNSLLVTAGATGALAAALGSLTAPDEEVLVLAPYWPLIPGVVRSVRAAPIEVPFYDRVDDPEAAVEAVRARLSARTVALYVSTPSNPTGRVLSAPVLAALAEWARREDLWILSDEVYERIQYAGKHVSIGTFAPERTLSVFSFSKAYGMAGNRVGYLVGPPDAITQARKISTHTFYAAPTAGQWAALRALERGEAWLADALDQYRSVAAFAAGELGLPMPEGSTFLFLDVASQLDERGVWGFLEDCLEDGVVLAPGPSSGGDYTTWVRLCYTAAPPQVTRAAVS
ncbi:MAG: pyridoxal phosphate-dependent aminotransferase, partial [Proteobacteria bacterium]|nr:pyridoxal phosphate-dependent aminotransferase [Pseudomonadota bacterium]